MGPEGEEAGRMRWLGRGCLALGAGVAANAILGPLGLGLVEYPVSGTVLAQTVGLDAFGLMAFAPLAVVAGVLCLGGHPAGPVLALGLGGWTAYMYLQYVVGPGYLVLPPALLLHLALFVLGWLVAVRAWHAVDGDRLAMRRPGEERVLAAVVGGFGLFTLLRYVPWLIGSLTAEPLPPEARGDPAMFWSILLLDLGVVVPSAFWAAWRLVRRRGLEPARKGAAGLVVWFALTATSVAAMAVAMYVRGDPYASVGLLVILGTAAVVGLGAAVWLGLALRAGREG